MTGPEWLMTSQALLGLLGRAVQEQPTALKQGKGPPAGKSASTGISGSTSQVEDLGKLEEHGVGLKRTLLCKEQKICTYSVEVSSRTEIEGRGQEENPDDNIDATSEVSRALRFVS